jgi:DNA-binding beta-propeller fold protein YncE
MFEGGKGLEFGQLDFPRGMAVDSKGNILIADTNNGRLQRFSPDGMFLRVIGSKGDGPGEFREPSGVAVDSEGYIYVADTGNRRVQKLNSDGSFVAQWRGADPGFDAPREIAIGSDNSVYVVDESRAEIIKFASDGNVLAAWGSRGSGNGEFNTPTSIAVDTQNNKVYVSDPVNRKIQIFDTNGQFVTSWFVPEWRQVKGAWYMQHLVIDRRMHRMYATSTQTDEVLVFSLNGTRMASLRPKSPEKLEGASALVLINRKLYVLCTFSNRVVDISSN